MLVEIPHPVAVSATNSFGEIWVVGDAGTEATGINSRGGITISREDFNPERIQIDDGIDFGATAGIALGDGLGSVVGVMSYDFENFEVDTLSDLVVTPAGLAPETTALRSGPDALTVATFNVLNLSPSAGARFGALAQIIVTHLGAPDIIGLEEVQDDNGAIDDGTVSADLTFETLITAIETVEPALADVYDFAQIDPLNNQDGGEPGGNIRVGFLYRTDRVGLAPGTPGNAVTNTEVLPGPELSLNPGRLLDSDLSDGDAFEASRKPLAAEFVFGGRSVFVVVNHFNSKGGDQPLYGPSQPPTLVSEAQRLQQAQRVNDFVDDILAEDPTAAVVVLGDFNDFGFSKPLSVLEGPGGQRILWNLVDRLPNKDRYTFIFDGNSQALDGILVSLALLSSKGDIVHTNTGLLSAASDHDPIVARIELK